MGRLAAMPMEHPEENERELLPEIVVDEAAEDYVVMEEAHNWHLCSMDSP